MPKQLGIAAGFLTAVVLTTAPAEAAPKFSILYTFKGGSDGNTPIGGLARDASGNLYGATGAGGGSGNCHDGCGTIYKIDPHGKEKVLHSFSGHPDGMYPFPVILDPSGNIYGMTLWGGDPTCSCGTAYRIDTKGTLTVLHTFVAGRDGTNPESPFVMDASGNLYGTTVAGGAGGGCTNQNPVGCGVLFRLSLQGKETILHAFTGPDGADPSAGLLRDSKGNLYGTTLEGGASNYGTVFEFGADGKYRVLHDFSGSGADNGYPYDGLAKDGKGDLYGTTEWHPSGSYTFGTVFKLARKGHSLQTLFTFNGTDGGYPVAGLLRDAQGNLYGTTLSGGSCQYNQCGVVFEVTRDGSEKTLYNFQEGNDGYAPQAILVQDAGGNLYGTALGGADGDGVVFKIKP